MAEIDEKVTICEHRGGEVKEIRVEKYALISTHTARRSFATHLQRSKVPLSSISMALGHKKVTTTMRYLRLGVLLYLPEAPFLRILKRTSNSIYPTFYPTQKKRS